MWATRSRPSSRRGRSPSAAAALGSPLADWPAANVAPFAGKRGSTVRRFCVLEVAAAVGSGILAWAAFPPARVPLGPVVALVAFVPLFLVARTASPRRALALGWLSGASMTALGFAFLVPAAVRHGGVGPIPALGLHLILAAYLGLFVALPLALASWARSRLPPPITAAVLLAAAEVALPAPIPWSFGASLVDVTPLAQLASIFGAPALSLVAFGTAGVITELVAGHESRKARAVALVWLAALGGASAWGAIRLGALAGHAATAPRTVVGVAHLGAAEAGARAPSAVFARARALAANGAEVVVTPESALAGVWPATELEGAAVVAAGAPGVTLVTGAVVRDAGHLYNSAVLFLPDGSVGGRYDKRRLLPFAERVPFADTFAWARSLSPRSGGFTPGASASVLEAEGARLEISICFEDLFSSVRPARGAGSDLALNLTNDAWFSGSAEPESHLAIARLRAIESGKYLVRATSGGVSAVVGPDGGVTASLGADEPGDLVASVPRLGEPTPFARVGVAPFVMLCAALLGIAERARLRPRASAPS